MAQWVTSKIGQDSPICKQLRGQTVQQKRMRAILLNANPSTVHNMKIFRETGESLHIRYKAENHHCMPVIP